MAFWCSIIIGLLAMATGSTNPKNSFECLATYEDVKYQ
jgi:hypothetical protein